MGMSYRVMTKGSNDNQIKPSLIEQLNKTLFIEYTEIDRLNLRINQTPIPEVKQRLQQHLEETQVQKSRLIQIILLLKGKPVDYKENLTTSIPNISGIIEKKYHKSLPVYDIGNSGDEDNDINFKNKNKKSDIDRTELSRIKQDFIIEYDEVVAYNELIHMTQMSESSQKYKVMQLLKDSLQEEESMVYWYQLHTSLILDNLWPKLINTPVKRGQNFLLKYVGSKIPIVLMYADLVGSTKMSMTLPIDSLLIMIRAFTQELSNVVERFDGYVLKYVGDAVISFFPSIINYNKYLQCKKSLECAKSIINTIKKEINEILSEKYGYPELFVKIGIDEGENAIIQYGYESSSPIDILGYSMNVASKITSLTGANKISIGENVYKFLDYTQQLEFKELSIPESKWQYINRDTKESYKIYMLK
jgi:adenylate cyclase